MEGSPNNTESHESEKKINFSEHFQSEIKDGTEETEAKKKAAIEKIERERLEQIDSDIELYSQLIEQLNEARQKNKEYEEVYEYIESFPDIKKEFEVKKKGQGKYFSTRGSSHDLIEFLAESAYQIIKSRETEKEKLLNSKDEIEDDEEESTTETTDNKITDTDKKGNPENEPATPTPEDKIEDEIDRIKEKLSDKPLEELREIYIQSKKLRGNALRGRIGELFGRDIVFDGGVMNFGGEEGEMDLSFIRDAYEQKLKDERETLLKNAEDELHLKLERGQISDFGYYFELKKKIESLLSAEQRNIDDITISETEKNLFDKIKEGFRSNSKLRILLGGLIGGGSFAGQNLMNGEVGFGAGLTGTYLASEAMIERWSKLIGHRGLVDEIENNLNPISISSLRRQIYGIDPEKIKAEAARLRMLQVERGLNLLDDPKIYNDDRDEIAELVIKRDMEITALEIIDEVVNENPSVVISRKISERLAEEVNKSNESIENEVDRERIKKMIRKSISVTLGIGGGWIIGR